MKDNRDLLKVVAVKGKRNGFWERFWDRINRSWWQRKGKERGEEPPVWPEIPSHPPGIPERQPSPREAFSSQTASCEQTETGHMWGDNTWHHWRGHRAPSHLCHTDLRVQSILVYLSPWGLETLLASLSLSFSIFDTIIMLLGKDLWANVCRVLQEPWLKAQHTVLD